MQPVRTGSAQTPESHPKPGGTVRIDSIIRQIAQFTTFFINNYELEQSLLQNANYDPVLKRACMPNGPQPHPRPETHPKPVETVRNRYNNSMNSSIFTPEVNN